MRWHYRLGHKPFARLKSLAENGEIPKRLARIRPPRCAGCLYGAMTKVPWRSKGQRDSTHPVFAATKPGECVSVDHMQSTEPGFYGQSKGILTKTRYRNATIFVDHYSRLKFVYLMTSNLTGKETIDAKRAFERFAAEHGVRIAHYHCDNGSLRRQSLPSSMRIPRPKAHLLWGQRSLPKWHRRGSHSRPLQKRSQAAPARKAVMAEDGQHSPLAVRSVPRRSPEQCPPDGQGWQIQARAFQRNQSWVQHEISTHFWLSCVCTAQCSSFKQLNPTMGSKSTPWAQSGS